MNRVCMASLWIVSAALAAGCSGGSSGGNGGGGGGGGGGAPPPPGGDPYVPPAPPPPEALMPTFESIQANVFTPICTACHVGAAAPEGLILDAANSYGLLVNVSSVQAPDLLRVNPGNPNDSYLIMKLEGTAAVGARMPDGGPPLPQSDIDVIRHWIIEGAMQNASASAKAVRASGASIVPNSTLLALPRQIVIIFDRDIDATTANLYAVSLQRSGGDGLFDNGTQIDIPIASVSVPLANPRALHLHLQQPTADVPDDYRLVIAGSGPNPILDHQGNRLNGGWLDGVEADDSPQGVDLVLDFTVAPEH